MDSTLFTTLVINFSLVLNVTSGAAEAKYLPCQYQPA